MARLLATCVVQHRLSVICGGCTVAVTRIVSPGPRESVYLEEVEPADRARVLRRYLQVAPGARPHIPVDRRAPLAEFARIAADYPLFRIHADPT
jgi:hypothetical protein